MYHFIRRFFIFVLVLAFGFSFLLCCFVHTGRCQVATGVPIYFNDAYGGYGGASTEYWASAVLEAWGSSNYKYENMNRTYQSPRSGLSLTQVPMYSIYGMPTLGGYIEDALMGRTAFAHSTSILQYIPNLVSRSYITDVAATGPNVLLNDGQLFNARTSYPSFLTTMPGWSTSVIPPGTNSWHADISFGEGMIAGIGSGCPGWSQCIPPF